MSALNMLVIGRGLYRWRKVIAVAVIAESIMSHKMKNQKKKSKQPDIMNQASDIFSEFRSKAEDYIEQTRKSLKK